jgi:hypothetical protein
MEVTTRGLWTMIHGMGFGALYLLLCTGALVELFRRYSPQSAAELAPRGEAFLRNYLIAMAVLAWIAVLTGTYVLYPWYRAQPPPGTTDLTAFPQRLLMSSAATAGWHDLGMEWKEHVAWLVPISITMTAAVVARYGREIRNHPELRAAVLCFTLASFVAAGIAGFFGAMLNKHAPVEGGSRIQIPYGERQ